MTELEADPAAPIPASEPVETSGYLEGPYPPPPSAADLLIQVRSTANQALGMCVVLDRAIKTIAERAETMKTRAIVEPKKAREFYLRAAECADVVGLLSHIGASAQRVLRETVERNKWLAPELGIEIQRVPVKATERQEAPCTDPPTSSPDHL